MGNKANIPRTNWCALSPDTVTSYIEAQGLIAMHKLIGGNIWTNISVKVGHGFVTTVCRTGT